MNKQRQIFIYEKMGDIAHQIYSLELRKMQGKTLPTTGRQDLEDPDTIIPIHWKRIQFLENCLDIPNINIRKSIERVKSELCDKCKDTQVPCDKDFENVCLLKLGEEVIKYED